jgi:eukaryotic-like serine/threonine-protein kinase
MKSDKLLLQKSGYADCPSEFDRLLRILDAEIRLITPVEVYGIVEEPSVDQSATGRRNYQLTHDYLVPSLREWMSSVNRDKFEDIYERLLVASPTELHGLSSKLKRYRTELVERLWNVLEQTERAGNYLQAASVLALYDQDNTRWQTACGNVAEAMVTASAAELRFWLEALHPVRACLTTSLSNIFRDKGHSVTERSQAADILMVYAGDETALMTGLLLNADSKSYAILFPVAQRKKAESVALLRGEIEKKITSVENEETLEDTKDQQSERQARAAVALVRMGETETVWPLLRHSPDPRLRSYIVNWMASLGVDSRTLVAELERFVRLPNSTSAQKQAMDAILFDPETSVQRALILALGMYETERLCASDREPLTGKLLDLYRNDPDSGIHGAAEWTLRRWGQQWKLKLIDGELMKFKDRGDRRWYVNSRGQTFAVIDGPVEFLMGSPETEPERYSSEFHHNRAIPRRFAIATKEVTVEEYQEFLEQNPEIQRLGVDRYVPDPTCPRNRMTWYDAAAYCNWLSEKEEVLKDQLCFEPREGTYVEGMTIPKDVLERRGFRLPTEAEWEYACRAGALTSRYYGHSVDLLDRYARYSANSDIHAWPCGSLLPNDLGLFDMLGNVYEWCQGAYEAYQPDEQVTLSDAISLLTYRGSKGFCVLRGGNFASRPAFIRSAFRGRDAPSSSDDVFGFRLARTVP